MGSRIIVMKDGFMQQQDTPQNLYDYPANLFVGCFIGTPQMNVFKVKLEKRGDGIFAVFGSNAIRVPAGKIQRMTGDYIGKEVYMGIRPENIHDDQAFIARVDPRTASRSGDRITVGFDVHRLHFFDLKTENTILSRA